MEDKEMIEEMAKDLKEIETDVGHKLVNETFSYVKEHKKYNPKEDYSLAHIKTVYQLTAEEMVKRGWLKHNEDSIVLTREEWDKLMGDTYTSKEVDEIVAYKERVKTREVSRDILTKLACDFSGLDGMDVEYPLNKVKEFAKQVNVEIKE